MITAAHEISHPITRKENVTFQTLTDFESRGGNKAKRFYDEIIADFKSRGGIHAVHLAGHEHSDMFGKTDFTYRDMQGTCRVHYSVIPSDADLRYTVIALQENGVLENYDDLKMTDVIAGHLTVEELLAYADSSASSAKTAAFIFAAVLAGIGVLMIVRASKTAEPAAQKKSKKRV